MNISDIPTPELRELFSKLKTEHLESYKHVAILLIQLKELIDIAQEFSNRLEGDQT